MLNRSTDKLVKFVVRNTFTHNVMAKQNVSVKASMGTGSRIFREIKL